MQQHPKPTLVNLFKFWFRVGFISWGGMYAILPKIEDDLERWGWMDRQRVQESLAVATLVPGPSFLSLAGLCGYEIAGTAGSIVSLFSLLAPPAILITAALLLVTPEMLHGPMAPIIHWLTVAVVGVMLGNAWRMATKAPRSPGLWRGLLVLALTTAAILWGVSTVVSVIGGIVLSAFLLKEATAK